MADDVGVLDDDNYSRSSNISLNLHEARTKRRASATKSDKVLTVTVRST